MMEGVCTHRFKLPKNILLTGCSQSGKSQFINRLLLEKEKVFHPTPQRVIYCYTAWQPCYDDLQSALADTVVFRTDIPSTQELTDLWEQQKVETILVLDDKMSSLKNDSEGRSIVDVVCVLSHHCHISCLITTQNLFHSQILREISLNCHYICLFRNNRSHLQVKTLGMQIMPRLTDYFMDSYEKATERNYGYLLIDLCPDTDKKLRLKSNVFPGEDLTVYLPKK